MRDGVQGVVDLVDQARHRGARGAEVLAVVGEGLEIEVDRGKVTGQEPLRTSEVVVRVWVDHGPAGVARGRAEVAERLVAEALERAGKGDGEPDDGPVGRLPPAPGGLGVDDRRHGMLTIEDRVDVVLAAERGARGADRRARTEGFRYEERRVRRSFANSRHVTADEWSTTYAAEGRVHLGDDRGEIALAERAASRAFASIASFPFGGSLVHRAVALLGAPLPVSGPLRTMLPPRVFCRIFERLGPLFTEASLAAGATFLSKGDPERPLFSPMVHLLDDGTVPGSLRTTAFDDRGVPPVPLTLLREGRVDARLLDPATARRLDTRPTGHWHGDGLRPNNLVLRAGTRSQNAILTEIHEPVLLVDDVAAWERFDLGTGDVRLRVHGHLSRRTKVEGPVRDVVIEGNLVEVFNRIVEVASDTDRAGHVDGPAVLLDGFVAV